MNIEKYKAMVILKYHEWLSIAPDDFRGIVYELCEDNFKKIRIIKKEEALQLIRMNRLSKVHHNKYGTIWR